MTDGKERRWLRFHPSSFFLLLLIHFLFFKAISWGFGLPLSNEKILVLALLVTFIQGLRDFVYLRRLEKQERERQQLPPEFVVLKEMEEEKFRQWVEECRRKIPPLTAFLLVLNTFFFLLTELAGGATNIEVLARFGAKLPAQIWWHHEYWRLFAATLLHAGFLHFFMNMLALYLFGGIVEHAYGSATFWLIYFFSAVTSILGSLFFLPHPGVGASGAIFGIVGALVVMGFRYRKKISIQYRDLYSWVLAVYIGLDVLFSFMMPIFDTYAHLSGCAAGAVVAYFFGVSEKTAVYVFGESPSHERKERHKKGRVLALSTAFLAFLFVGKTFLHVVSPSPLHSQEPLFEEKNLWLGIQFRRPAWLSKGLATPTFSHWQARCEHSLTFFAEHTKGRSLEELFSDYLQSLRGEQKIQWERLPSPKKSWAVFWVHNPSEEHQPPSELLAISIWQNYGYYFSLRSYEPKRLLPLLHRILRSTQFSPRLPLEKTREAFLTLIQKHPQNPILLNQYGWFLAGEGEYLEEGIRYVQQAVILFRAARAHPPPWLWDTLVELYLRKGDLEKAKQELLEALSVYPQIPYLQKKWILYQELKFYQKK